LIATSAAERIARPKHRRHADGYSSAPIRIAESACALRYERRSLYGSPRQATTQFTRCPIVPRFMGPGRVRWSPDAATRGQRSDTGELWQRGIGRRTVEPVHSLERVHVYSMQPVRRTGAHGSRSRWAIAHESRREAHAGARDSPTDGTRLSMKRSEPDIDHPPTSLFHLALIAVTGGIAKNESAQCDRGRRPQHQQPQQQQPPQAGDGRHGDWG